MNGAIDTVFDVMSGVIDIVEAHGCKDEEDIRPWLSERLAAYAPQKAEIDRLRAALGNYMMAVDMMNAAMKDGINAQGAISMLIGAEDMARAALSETSNGKD